MSHSRKRGVQSQKLINDAARELAMSVLAFPAEPSNVEALYEKARELLALLPKRQGRFATLAIEKRWELIEFLSKQIDSGLNREAAISEAEASGLFPVERRTIEKIFDTESRPPKKVVDGQLASAWVPPRFRKK